MPILQTIGMPMYRVLIIIRVHFPNFRIIPKAGEIPIYWIIRCDEL
jgi:hypothetical protein